MTFVVTTRRLGRQCGLLRRQRSIMCANSVRNWRIENIRQLATPFSTVPLKGPLVGGVETRLSPKILSFRRFSGADTRFF